MTTRAMTWCSAAAFVAAVYFYFLVFVQFAFLEMLAATPGEALLRPAMAAMGAGGILGSLIAPVSIRKSSGSFVLRAGLACCAAVAAGCAILPFNPAPLLFLAFCAGLTTGVTTVALAGQLRTCLGNHGWGLPLGVGTGLAYFAANVPGVFTASPGFQAGAAAAVCLTAVFLPIPRLGARSQYPAPHTRRNPVILGFLAFAVLVGLDSGVFYVIQHTPRLHEATWGSPFLLWRNGAVHLAAGLIAGWQLERGRALPLLAISFILITSASALVAWDTAPGLGGLLYPAAVSLYSTALVAWPAYLSQPPDAATALHRAAALYAISGWAGSGLGIGLAENVRSLPPGVFALIAAAAAAASAAVFLIAKRRRPAIPAALLILAASWTAHRWDRAAASPTTGNSAVQRGRAVYIAEGCIHCHSRYPRPGTLDEVLWGPPAHLRDIESERPVLIGNRRHGPDLFQVGNRRSTAWLREKLKNPQLLQPRSIMPCYAHLFRDGRGEDLIAFLSTLPEGSLASRVAVANTWLPSEPHRADPLSLEFGRALFDQLCAACHGADGCGNGKVAARLTRPPANLVLGPLPHTGDAWPPDERRIRVLRAVKFGIPGTDMPGHETLDDREVAALCDFLLELRKPGTPESP